jgi:hypothetical protein
MKKFLTLAAATLLTGAACLADGASAANQQNILPGGCIVLPPDGPVVHNQRRDPAHFVIRAQIQWAGNIYFRMPDGTVGGTLKGCAWEGCYIVANGKTIRVAGLPGDDIVDQQSFKGKTLVLVGQLVYRYTPPDLPNLGEVPPDVLIVDRYWIVN